MLVAHAAPAMPNPALNISIGSSTRLTIAPRRTDISTFLAAPSPFRRLVIMPILMMMEAQVLRGNMYSAARSFTLSAPINTSIGVRKKRRKTEMPIDMMIPDRTAVDAISSALSLSPLPRCRDMLADAPMPNPTPMHEIMMYSGLTMDTAVIASGPRSATHMESTNTFRRETRYGRIMTSIMYRTAPLGSPSILSSSVIFSFLLLNIGVCYASDGYIILRCRSVESGAFLIEFMVYPSDSSTLPRCSR